MSVKPTLIQMLEEECNVNKVNIVRPTHHFVVELNNIIRSYPPIIGVSRYDQLGNHLGVQDYPMPYTVTDICSRCIKVAAAPNSIDSQQFIAEFKTAIAPFDQEVNAMLTRQVQIFIQYLVTTFQRFGWYDASQEAPHRFVGFCENTLDIELRSN